MTNHTKNFSRPPAPSDILIAILFGLACVLTFYIYYPGINGPMILDDYANIVHNHGIKITQIDKESLYQAATSMNGAFTSDRPELAHRPISHISFALNYYFAKDFFKSLKLSNLFIHLGVGFLLFGVCSQLVRKLPGNHPSQPDLTGVMRWLPLLVSTAWLLHPSMVSTVLYSVQRATMLSALFCLAGINAFIYYREKLLLSGTGFWFGLASVSLFTLLAFLSKENGVLTVTLCVVIEVCFFRFKFHPDIGKITHQSYMLLLCLPTILIIAYLIQQYLTASNDALLLSRNFDYDMRLLSQLRILFYYLYWFLVPTPSNLTFIHDTISPSEDIVTPITTAFAGMGWLAIVGTVIYLVIKNKLTWLAFGILWFTAGHLIESTVVPLELVFEHRNYLPYAGPLFSLVYFLIWLVNRFRFSGAFWLFLLFFLIVAIPAALLAQRVLYWQSEAQLIAHWHEINNNSPRVWAKTADYYFNQTRNTKATLGALDKALQLNPAEAGYGLAQIAIMCSAPESFRPEEVIAIRQRTFDALVQPPTTVYTVNQYGNLLNRCSDLRQIKILKNIHEKAATLNRQTMSQGAHFMLALLALDKGELTLAKNHLQKARTSDHYALEASQMLEQINQLIERKTARLQDAPNN